MTRWLLAALALLLLGLVPWPQRRPDLRVGSKKFTESVILGEMLTQLGEEGGRRVVHYRELGGTRILFNALERGEIDVYPEYSGTIRQEILAELALADDAAMRAALAERGISATAPLGFNNTYAIGVLPELADSLDLTRVSDLRAHPVGAQSAAPSPAQQRRNAGFRCSAGAEHLPFAVRRRIRRPQRIHP